MLCSPVDEAYFIIQADSGTASLHIFRKLDDVKFNLLELVLRALIIDTIHGGFEQFRIFPNLILALFDKSPVYFMPILRIPRSVWFLVPILNVTLDEF